MTSNEQHVNHVVLTWIRHGELSMSDIDHPDSRLCRNHAHCPAIGAVEPSVRALTSTGMVRETDQWVLVDGKRFYPLEITAVGQAALAIWDDGLGEPSDSPR